MSDYKFVVTKDGLTRDSEIKSLHAQNEHYNITVFYYGDYKTDKKQNQIDYKNLSITCKEKKDNLKLSYITPEFFINDVQLSLIATNDISLIKQKLIIAEKSISAIKQLLKTYF